MCVCDVYVFIYSYQAYRLLGNNKASFPEITQLHMFVDIMLSFFCESAHRENNQ